MVHPCCGFPLRNAAIVISIIDIVSKTVFVHVICWLFDPVVNKKQLTKNLYLTKMYFFVWVNKLKVHIYLAKHRIIPPFLKRTDNEQDIDYTCLASFYVHRIYILIIIFSNVRKRLSLCENYRSVQCLVPYQFSLLCCAYPYTKEKIVR